MDASDPKAPQGAPYRLMAPLVAAFKRRPLVRLTLHNLTAAEAQLYTGQLEKRPLDQVVALGLYLRVQARSLEELGIRDESNFDNFLRFIPVVTAIFAAAGLLTAHLARAFVILALAVVPWWYCVVRLRGGRHLTALSKRVDALASKIEEHVERRRKAGEVPSTTGVRVDLSSADRARPDAAASVDIEGDGQENSPKRRGAR